MSTKTLSGVYTSVFNLAAPVTTVTVTASGYLTAGLSATGTGTYTIVNHGKIEGSSAGVALNGAGIITNTGTIDSTSATGGAAITLGGGGIITNETGGLIAGYLGVVVAESPGTVANDGKIIAQGAYGVLLQAGGLITNGGVTDKTAEIEGNVALMSDLGATMHNYGVIISNGATGAGAYLKDGGSVANGSASDTTALITSLNIGVEARTAACSVINYGTIRAVAASSAEVYLEDGGLVTNGSVGDSTALVEGAADGILTRNQAATVNNFGDVIGGYVAVAGASGIYLDDGGVVTNGGATDKSAFVGGLNAVYFRAVRGTVSNFGTIGGLNSEFGVVLQGGGIVTNGSSNDVTALIQAKTPIPNASNQTVTIDNFGTIEGSPFIPAHSLAGYAVGLGSGEVTNGSTTDTKALITGAVGVQVGGVTTVTVTNFGSIVASESGVNLLTAGKIINGSATDTAALITGDLEGVVAVNDPGTVVNGGSIIGGAADGSFGVFLKAGGSVTNGSASNHTALIQGLYAIDLSNGGTVVNDAIISGDTGAASVAVTLLGGADLTNNAGALVTGAYFGVYGHPGSTVTNFGTIEGTGAAVFLTTSGGRVNAESGSVFEGVIAVNGGVIDAVAGVATASGVSLEGKVEGAGTLSVNGAESIFFPGATLTVTEFEVGGAATVVDVDEKLGDSRVWAQSAGTLTVSAGEQMTFTGTGDSFSGTVDGAGTVLWSGGTDTFSAVSLSAAKMAISTAAVTLSNSVNITGTLTATTKNLILAAGGATLAGGELLLTNNATNSLHGASSSAVLTNEGTIRGAGQVGGGTMSLVNSGLIESAYATALTINTGSNTVINSGVIEAAGSGELVIASAVDNTGTLASVNSTLTVDGSVTGTGIVHVFGGEVIFNGAFTEHVSFGSTGELVLARSTAFAGTVSSFSQAGTTSFDLEDINFATAAESYSGTTASGVLTVTDGIYTAKIHLTGDYTAATWLLSADGGTGTIVKGPAETGQAPPAVHAMIAAAASFGAASASATPAHGPPPTHAELLAIAHV